MTRNLNNAVAALAALALTFTAMAYAIVPAEHPAAIIATLA
ncbi:MAG: hypothetical protein P0Y56_11805 [Candidatus Andeanibacterium colombiense]|uniref:Recombination protein F n=1 Tax=Candidatus Andeanibacterium colombiense TaxID=3121345 RepID=A0AAJ6BM48_9SPHN|nr:MAG: hypothetical protein P0Y56_11805 [Sphingomonadaceae bacterium]